MTEQRARIRNKVQVKFRVHRETKEKLDAIAKHRGTTLSAEIVRALTAYAEVMKPEEQKC